MKNYAYSDQSIIPKLICGTLIIMFFLGFFSEFIVRGQLFIWDDPNATLSKIQNTSLLFEVGIFAFVVIIILDVVLSVLFYALFHTKNKVIGLLMICLRLIYVAIKGFALVGLLLARDISFVHVNFSPEQIYSDANQVIQYLKMHHYGFGIGLIFFGLHLIFLAILVLKVAAIPKITGWLLITAGIGYCLNSLAGSFAPGLETPGMVIIAIFIVPMTISELLLGILLWVKQKKLFLF